MRSKSLAWLKNAPENIIVRMPNWLGDVVMATPVLADLRKQWPQARITAMAQDKVAPLLKDDPHIDELYVFHRPSGWIHRQHQRDIVRTLRRGDYDLGILLTNSFSSAWWFWRGRVNNCIGYAGNWRNSLLDNAVKPPKNIEHQHLVVTYKMLLSPLGMTVSERPPRMYVTKAELDVAWTLLKNQGVTDKHILVGINPGAAYGSAKCWLPSNFRAVTQRLLENPLIRIVYFGDQNGASLVNDICVGMPERVINLAGKTSIRELMALAQLCSVFLTNDSGPMHIVAALNVPLVALFGSTSDVKTGPYDAGVVIHKHVECSPCYQRECPIDFRCMKSIEVDEVLQEMQRFIKDVKK